MKNVTTKRAKLPPAPVIRNLIASIKRREDDCWRMAATFLENRDAHGVMDMGAELQALQRAITELEKLPRA